MKKNIKTIIVPVAGLGTRLWPLTVSIPKEMLPVYDKPLIQYAINEALEAGFEKFVFVVSPSHKILKNYLDQKEIEQAIEKIEKTELLLSLRDSLPKPDQVFFVEQKECLGLGHAIWTARDYIDEEYFAVMSPDDLITYYQGCLSQMLDIFCEHPGQILASMEVKASEISRYGILDIKKHYNKYFEIKDMVEKPSNISAPSNYAIIGRYILNKNIFDILDSQEKGVGGEIQITDAIKNMLVKHTCFGFPFKGHRFDCGTIEGLAEATQYFFHQQKDRVHKKVTRENYL